jgi:hypothetical protein
MIKAGQIYEFKEKSGIDTVVVTKEYPPTKDLNFYRYDLIFQDGEVWEWARNNNIQECMVLVAEYPTWEEAVNSKEFKND